MTDHILGMYSGVNSPRYIVMIIIKYLIERRIEVGIRQNTGTLVIMVFGEYYHDYYTCITRYV